MKKIHRRNFSYLTYYAKRNNKIIMGMNIHYANQMLINCGITCSSVWLHISVPACLLLSSILLFHFFPFPPAIGAELGEAIYQYNKCSDRKRHLFNTALQIVNIVNQMCNICVVQAVGEYFYFNLGEASEPEIDNSR